MIELTNIKYSYKSYVRREGFIGSLRDFKQREAIVQDAVKNINFTIHKGDIIGLLGQNGAGKTTLIKLMTGILEPTEGQITIDGFHPFNKEKSFLKEIGVVIGQKSQLVWDLPATETLRMLQVIYDIDEEDFKHRVEVMVDLLNLKEKVNTPVRKLSLGERIKFEIICSLIHSPKVLFLDEPTIGLDITSQYHIREFLLKMNQEEETTIIITSHYMKDIEALTEKIFIMVDGEMLQNTTIPDLKRQYTVDESFEITFKEEVPSSFEQYKVKDKIVTVPLEEMGAALQKIEDFKNIKTISNSTPSFEEIIYQIFSSSGGKA